MSEKQAKKNRAKERMDYIRAFNRWLDSEPSMLNIFAWRKWKKSRPKPCK